MDVEHEGNRSRTRKWIGVSKNKVQKLSCPSSLIITQIVSPKSVNRNREQLWLDLNTLLVSDIRRHLT